MEEKNNNSNIAKLSGLKTKDYIAYALGDVGCCLVFSLISTLLQRYYTDVLLLNPLFIMLMFVAARVWDAINDPMMGRICDSMKPSKWGRYRPWFLYASIPLVLVTILVFVKWPGFGSTASQVAVAIYATITYIAFGMAYTTLQIPYGSLASVVTADEKERTKLSVFRSVGATLGSMPVIILTMFCFSSSGVNYPIMMVGVVALCILGLVALVFAFLGNKERVISKPRLPEKGATLAAIKRLFKNRAIFAIAVASMLLLAGQMFTQTYYTYLINYYFGKEGIYTSLPMVLTYFPMAVLMAFTPKLVRKYGKKEICATGMAVAAVANLAMYFLKFLPADAAFWPFMGLCLVGGFGFNFFVLQVWAMATDAIDDLQVKTGIREDGTAYSFIMFFRKMGQVLAAIAVNGALLIMGYYTSATGTTFEFSSSQLGLMYDLATLIPAVLYGLMTLALFVWYPLSKAKVADLQVLKEEAFAKESIQ